MVTQPYMKTAKSAHTWTIQNYTQTHVTKIKKDHIHFLPVQVSNKGPLHVRPAWLAFSLVAVRIMTNMMMMFVTSIKIL